MPGAGPKYFSARYHWAFRSYRTVLTTDAHPDKVPRIFPLCSWKWRQSTSLPEMPCARLQVTQLVGSQKELAYSNRSEGLSFRSHVPVPLEMFHEGKKMGNAGITWTAVGSTFGVSYV